MTTRTFRVSGMSCQHCVNAVTDEVGKLDGVIGVDVDLPAGQVTVTSTSPVDDAEIAAAVDEAGYEVVA